LKSAAFSPEWLGARLAALIPEFPQVSLCVALSGGLDSVVLLAALAAGRAPVRSRRRGARAPRAKAGARSAAPALRAIHVHHGLHPNADRWAGHCTELAAQLGVPLEIVRVKVARTRGGSLEASAREARYAALGEALTAGEVLLTAHHQDDQLETVLLQLLRGAGVAGLAAMPDVAPFARGRLARPLLTRARFDLEEWARARGLAWVDDDTNTDERFDRNYLRRVVLPLVRERWPGAGAAVSRSARHAGEARRLLDALALADVAQAAIGASLSTQRLRALDPDRRRNALRFWIARAGFVVPDTRRLDEIAGPLLQARTDANPQVRWNGVLVERQADTLSIRAVSALPASSSEPETAAIEWSWREQPRLALTHPCGLLELVADPHGPLDLARLPTQLFVRRRRGGETLRPSARGRTRTLKALLRESRVAPAARDELPLVFSGDALLAVANRWVDASVQAAPGCKVRARLRFSPLDHTERQ
jgi:tRNA(Ile)-lysidine synthase